MVFHESLNPERKFSLAIPLVFIAILGGTTAVLEVATVLSPQTSFAVNPQSQLAEGAAPVGSDKSECTADSPTGQIDPATKKVKKVGKKCNPAAKKGEAIVTVDDGCEPNDYIKAGKCTVIYCAPGGTCAEIQQETEPKNIPQSTQQLFQMVRNVQTAPEGGAEFVGLSIKDSEQMPGTIFAKDLDDDKMMRWERGFSNDFDASIPAPNKGGISALDEIKRFGGEPATAMPAGYQGENTQTIDKLKNNASYLRPTSPALSESDLLRTPLSELNGKYKYGDLTVSTDGKTYTVWGEGQRAAIVNDVRDGQTVADIVATRQYMTGPESPYQYGRDTFAESVIAQGEVPYSSAPAGSAAPDTSAFDKWSGELPGAMKQGPAYDFSSGGALDPSVSKGTGDLKGGWTAATPEEQLELCAYGGCSNELERELRDKRDARIEELKKEQESMNAIGGTTSENQEELRRLEAQKALEPAREPEASCTTTGNTRTCFAYNEAAKEQLEKDMGYKCNDAGDGSFACNLNKSPKPGDKVPVPLPNPRPKEAPGGGGGGGGGGEKPGGGGGGDIGKALGSMLEGLMKALGAPKPPPSAPPQACATDPNAYAQQQQQYQQQLQQYNYQLQQAQYQRQMNQYYAERNGGVAPPAQPLPAQPTPCTPSTGNQCQSQPQQPPASACSAGSWRATYTGACVTGWQCISTAGPKAELSCEPKVADVGTTLAITYGCSSGVASSSSFKVTTQPGGSATTTVANPPAGTNTATYTLACTEGGKTTGAQCSVQVARTNIILVANPKTVPAGGTSLLSWLTTGMQSCIISSPDQVDFTARNSSNTSVTGAATTSAITTATSTVLFQLDCRTLAGTDKQATTSVSIAP